ncbi:hypothetical protein BO94DRAFT_80856 [Aspergillus sclerotioniger CBS 115572]|uniref:Zn(2)-C6 fungal-type domain-containing protein n=1 Tax=Aspergillus sclerotioniger CBS 115572 TaxID=1450535 RepID=A0A317WJ93_9EURO|nr:hypothetical protein BO94DRAFT_80856 [Aspergillus sclerotioniger CBS 115572]PWY86399.1 hypothetical protein BO94DRAFT_80856 [Aspergillus sclerotioniger CBS 115572]
MEVQSTNDKAACPFCGFQFNHRSSLIRHLKNNCNKKQPQRRKSCNQCVADKAKCNLKRPSCSRCSMRHIACMYAGPEPESPGIASAAPSVPPTPNPSGLDPSPTFQPQALASSFDPSLFEPFFSDLGCWTSLQSSELALRSPEQMESLELLSFPENIGCASPAVTPPVLSQQHQPNSNPNEVALANHSMELIFRVLRTWPQMLADEFQMPPIFHSTHFDPQAKLPRPLATCITLAKMWHGQREGAEGIVRETILKELDLIVHQKSEDLDEMTLLAVMQAAVIYTIILLSPSTASQTAPDNEEMVFRKVEALVTHVVRGGLFLTEERAQTRPCWDAWVHVTSKRRAVLALYLLHWAYSVLHKVPCFDCRDLGFMPAPAPKVLWEARSEQEWNTRYIHWLARWSGQIYLQAEFGHIPPGPTLNTRAEKWLGEADEFGFLMVSILNATDYEPPGLKMLQPHNQS